MTSLSAAPSMPSLWRPDFDPNEVKVQLPLIEEPKSAYLLRSILTRKHQPIQEAIKMKVEVTGVFAVPELWKNKMVRFKSFFMKHSDFCQLLKNSCLILLAKTSVIFFQDDPSEQAYSQDVRFYDMTFKGAKTVAREMTEEEKQEVDANKGGKKAPPASKGKGGKEEEPTAEELEAAEKAKQEREEQNEKLRQEWESLDENTKFFRTNEDPFKEASIRFMQAPDAEEDAPNPSI